MKESEGFTRLIPTLVRVVAMIGSFRLLALAKRSLPLGTAYAIPVGITIMGEPTTPGRLLSAALLIAGMVGLKLTSGH